MSWEMQLHGKGFFLVLQRQTPGKLQLLVHTSVSWAEWRQHRTRLSHPQQNPAVSKGSHVTPVVLTNL